MKTLVPISGTQYSPLEIFSKPDLVEILKEILGRKNCLLYGSGAQALYVAFKILSKITKKEEVIIPAYTADAVYVAAKEAGFRVKLCDISLDSFNMDLEYLKMIVNEKTAAVVAVHLFGIPENMDRVFTIIKDYSGLVIEDAAQALGSSYSGRLAGSAGDMAIFSFNKGKNLPALNGGALLFDKKAMAVESQKFLKNNSTGFIKEIKSVLKAGGVSFFSRPELYGSLYNRLSKFRKVSAKRSIEPGPMPVSNKRLASSLLKRREEIFKSRRETGIKLLEGLKGVKDLRVPRISPNSNTVFNRVPVIIKNLKKKREIKKLLMESGIEANYYYNNPFYFNREKIPEKAIYFSKHLLTIPSNEFMSEENIKEVIDIFRKVLDVSG